MSSYAPIDAVLSWQCFNPEEEERTIFAPQPGPQEEFLNTEADIAIFGGAAGGGKTVAELLLPLKWVDNSKFGAVIFRRTLKQVKDEGGIWDASCNIYPFSEARPNVSGLYWSFPSGATVQFAGCETENNKFDYQGSEICLLQFDELTHFTESIFFYLLSRNRSTCGVRPRVRATTNPEPGWVKRLLAPWVDRSFPGKRAKSGEIRWFIRENNVIVWVDEPPKRDPCTQGLNGSKCLRLGCVSCFPPEKSITFIRSSVYDNRKLLEANPEYVSNLLALPDLERRRLHDGDWDAKPENMVIDAFDESIHVILPFTVPKEWPRYVGMDFGSINTAFVILAEDPHTNNLYVIGEYWPAATQSDKVFADKIRELASGTPRQGAGGNRTTEQGWRIVWRNQGIPMAEPSQALAAPDLQYKCVNHCFGSGTLQVFETCSDLIGMIQSFQRKVADDGSVTDEFDDAKFHLCAALRYIITHLRPPEARAMAPRYVPNSGVQIVTSSSRPNPVVSSPTDAQGLPASPTVVTHGPQRSNPLVRPKPNRPNWDLTGRFHR